MNPPIVLSVGGSLLVPNTGIDLGYVKRLCALIRQRVKGGKRFILVVGGGSTARAYQNVARAVTQLTAEDVDWLGIHATRLNGHLLRSVFRDIAFHRVVKDPTRPLVWRDRVLIAAGWKPGWSTDYIAVRFAKKYHATRIVNLTNVDAVYDRDPSKFKDAKPYAAIFWKQFRKLVGSTWLPGSNAPFDPIASKLAQRWGIEVVIAQGNDFRNLRAILDEKKFHGTIISRSRQT